LVNSKNKGCKEITCLLPKVLTLDRLKTEVDDSSSFKLAVPIIYMLLWPKYNYRHVWNYQKSLCD